MSDNSQKNLGQKDLLRRKLFLAERIATALREIREAQINLHLRDMVRAIVRDKKITLAEVEARFPSVGSVLGELTPQEKEQLIEYFDLRSEDS